MADSRHRIRLTAWPALALLAATTAAGCQSPPATGENPTAPATAGTASEASREGCPATRPSGRHVGLTAPPEGVSWEMFKGVAVPVSSVLGPTRTTGDIARCYAHNPAGALLAALQIGVRIPLATRWKAVVGEQAYGDGRDGYVRARTERDAERGRRSPSEPGELLQPAGFRFDSYSDRQAVVSLAYRQPGGTLIQASTVTVRWHGGSDGDWRYELSRSPGLYRRLGNLKGYTLWEARL
ncbi:hypothetical protein ACH4ZX_07145 [Streptomyces sp. NPDC020490]|uniref:hypothetical protein n=1 Tax=Streptomyces sp. NPDC020490 TaxID=3365078 RepID=UPI003798C35D